MAIRKQKIHKDSINLYRFIRLILGKDISDRQIAQSWKMDEKNFHEFKEGKYPVPRLGKLAELASALKLDKYIICQVAEGVSAQKVYNLYKTDNHDGLIKLMSDHLYKAHKSVTKQWGQYRDLFNNANDAIFLADAKTGEILNCNQEAEILLGRSRKEIVGMHQSQLHPLQKKDYYKKHFKSHVKMGKIVETGIQQVVRKDGTIVPILISSRVMKINGRKVIQGIFRDISGQKSRR